MFALRQRQACDWCDTKLRLNMVDTKSETIEERVRVGEDVFINIKYHWESHGDQVDIFINYEDGHVDSTSFWPADPLDESRARDLAHMIAAYDYQWRNQAAD